MFPHHHDSDGGRAVLITAPTAAAVTLADAKIALGITDASQDNIVTAAIAAAADALDPAAGGWLGRALRTQTWELQLRSFGSEHRRNFPVTTLQAGAFPAHRIVLPYPPLQQVLSVKYFDVNGVDQTLLLGTDYRVLGMGQVYGKAAIAPLYQKSWPVPRVDDASVRIQLKSGYDDSAPLTKMPLGLKQAIILGARALMSITARDMLLFEDRVEGMGSKRYQNNPAAADIVTKAIGSLLFNLTIS